MTTSALLLAGSIRFQEKGQKNFRAIGESDLCEIQLQSETKSAYSRSEKKYGQTFASVALPKETNISLNMMELNKPNLMNIFLGEGYDNNQVSGTHTETIFIQKGVDIVLEHKYVNKMTFDSQTYEEGTDFVIDNKHGIISIPSSSNISEGQIEVGYSYSSTNGFKILGALKPSITTSVLLTGTNLVNQRQIRFLAYQAKLTSSENINFLSTDFQSLKMTGILETPHDKPSSFEYEEYMLV